MKRLIFLLSLCLLFSHLSAQIPYCAGTKIEDTKQAAALQKVINTFASHQSCVIGNNCILNFDIIKYSIAWDQPCLESAKMGNDPLGSTFICTNHFCVPMGFSYPRERY